MEKGLLKNFAKFIGKHLCQSLFLNKLQVSVLCENFKNSFFTEQLRTTGPIGANWLKISEKRTPWFSA